MNKSTATSQNGAAGAQFPPIEIVRLRRVCQSQPTAWEAVGSNGRRLHVAYRFGELTVSICHDGAEGKGRVWTNIVTLHPYRMEAELDWKSRQNGCAENRYRRAELQREAVMFELSELRAKNRDIRKSRVVSFSQLCKWLEMRSRNLVHLRQAGLAGGRTDVLITALGDGT